MLAPLAGQERLLTLATSHIAAFVKAVMANCKTNIPEMTANGTNLSLEVLTFGKGPLDDAPLNAMCKKGWIWRVLPAELENHFPEVVLLIQQSFNSGHTITRPPTEIECAATIASYYLAQKNLWPESLH